MEIHVSPFPCRADCVFYSIVDSASRCIAAPCDFFICFVCILRTKSATFTVVLYKLYTILRQERAGENVPGSALFALILRFKRTLPLSVFLYCRKQKRRPAPFLAVIQIMLKRKRPGVFPASPAVPPLLRQNRPQRGRFRLALGNLH